MPDDTTTLSSFDADGVQIAWDATSIHLAETCLRKYYYKMVEGWSPKSNSVHLLFGGWYATALEHYYKYRAEGDASHEALRRVVREALVATWEYETEPTVEGDTGYPEGVNIIRGSGRPWHSDHNAKTRENLIRTIIWYVDQFENEEIHVVQLADGKPAVELSFTLEIEDILLCGHIDRLVEYSGDVYVMDQKTTGTTINAGYFNKFSPNMQMSTYTFAGQIIYNLPVKGVIIDAAQIAVGFTRFARGFTFRTRSQLEEWYETAMYHVRRGQQAVRENHFPMNTSSCDLYGGCEFRHICARSPEVRQNFLRGDFVKGERWEPLKRR